MIRLGLFRSTADLSVRVIHEGAGWEGTGRQRKSPGEKSQAYIALRECS